MSWHPLTGIDNIFFSEGEEEDEVRQVRVETDRNFGLGLRETPRLPDPQGEDGQLQIRPRDE